MEQEILSILEPKEKAVWEGVVNRKVLCFNLFISVVIILGISIFFFSKDVINYTSNGLPKTISGTLIGVIILVLGLLGSLLAFLSNFVKRYIITNKRVLFKSGLIGTDFNSIYFTQMKSANVNVGLLDKIFSVGTLNIDTGKIETVQSGGGSNRSSTVRTQYDKLLHISDPYEVYKHLHTTLTGREESLYSGRADKENNSRGYKK